jgi:methylenetetrahydrofolate dehydrogenase (NADP+)/methenyltetrahydrofolate cyclohydrolase
MQLIDGKLISAQIQDEIALEVEALKLSGRRAPHLAAILVGNDGASETYVASKVKSCEKVGFASSLLRFPENISEIELLKVVEDLNTDDSIDGFIVQLPLPKHIDANKILLAVNPDKDVDGFHPTNVGKMVLNLPSFIPATPYGILMLLERYKIETAGKQCVVIGRSNIVGFPMTILMGRNAYPGNCTVSMTHSKTKDLKAEALRADILIAALGRPEFVTADMVKEGAVVIDVGITRVTDHTKKSGFAIKGDVKFDEVAPKCSYITPVPGGVGLMTVTALLKNTLQAYYNRVDMTGKLFFEF